MQNGDDHDTAEVHDDEGAWVALADAAQVLDVSVDTVKRRMKRGELESRRETIPQGFRWLVRIDPPKTEASESPESVENENRDIAVPSESSDLVTALQHELQVRNADLARMQDTVSSQARAIEQQASTIAELHQRIATLQESVAEASGSPAGVQEGGKDESVDQPAQTQQRGAEGRLRAFLRWLSGSG